MKERPVCAIQPCAGFSGTAKITLKEGYSFCQIGEEAVFFDEQNDRYLLIPPTLRADFQRLVGREEIDEPQLDQLMALGLFAAEGEHGPPLVPCDAPIPPHSIFDGTANEAVGIPIRVEVAYHLNAAHKRLRRSRLPGALNRIRKWKSSYKPEKPFKSEEVERFARKFDKARRSAPYQPRCLPDSLALFDFLASRSIPSSLVFGVKLDSFAAHCWIQAGDTLLNETVEEAAAFTQIRIA